MRLTVIINYSDASRTILRHIKKVKPVLKNAGITIRAETVTQATAKWKSKIPILLEGPDPLAATPREIARFLDELIVESQKELKKPAALGGVRHNVETDLGLDEWQTNMIFRGREDDLGREEGTNGISSEDINARLNNYNSRCKPPPQYKSTGLAERLGMRRTGERNMQQCQPEPEIEDRRQPNRQTSLQPNRQVMPGLEDNEKFAMPEMETPIDTPEYETDGQSLLDQFGGLID